MTTAMTLSIHLLWAVSLLGGGPVETPAAAVAAVVGAEADVDVSSPESFTMVADRPEQVVTDPRPMIDEALRPLMDDQHIVGLAVGVVEAGHISFLKGYGYADREAAVPVDARQTMFRWASISKPLTAIVATTLQRGGVVDFDGSIKTWYPEYRVPRKFTVECKRRRKTVEVFGAELECEDGFADARLPRGDRVITLRQLLSHTAGIIGFKSPRGRVFPKSRDLNDPKRNKGLEWGLKRLFTKPLLNPPGAAFNYSTFGFNLAAIVMQRAAGKAYPDLVRDIIASPVGMTSLQPDYEWVDIPHRAAGYKAKKRRGKVREMKRQTSYDVSWKMAGGGFVSTAEDLARFCGALMDESLLSADEKQRLWTEQITTEDEPTEYGLGFSVGTHEGRRYIEHAGVQTKARSRLRLYPDEDLCIVVMSNSTTAKTGAIVKAVDATLQLQARVMNAHGQ